MGRSGEEGRGDEGLGRGLDAGFGRWVPTIISLLISLDFRPILL